MSVQARFFLASILKSTGGYDTVNLKACTEAGVLCVNQAGGNKEAVAEHALAMMLSLTKRIVEADRAIRREILHWRSAVQESGAQVS